MKKMLLLVGLCFGLTIPGIQAEAAQTPASHGNLIYEAEGKSVSLYASDILLLEEKISSITERCFDPVCYAHTHHWEYCQVNESTHTRHCEDCGEAGDLTSVHRPDHWENDTIYYEGRAYPGIRYTCACGYQWTMEVNHTLVYEAVDELSHRCRCVLDETVCCPGCEPFVEEHYAWYYETSDDGLHHMKICFDCGYRMEEECRFCETGGEQNQRVCICGRSAAPGETSDGPGTEDGSDNPGKPETEEGSESPGGPGAEDGPESPGEPGAEDGSESPGEPGAADGSDSPGEPGAEDGSDSPDEPGAEEGPDSPGESGAEDGPDSPGESGTADTSGTPEASGH